MGAFREKHWQFEQLQNNRMVTAVQSSLIRITSSSTARLGNECIPCRTRHVDTQTSQIDSQAKKSFRDKTGLFHDPKYGEDYSEDSTTSPPSVTILQANKRAKKGSHIERRKAKKGALKGLMCSLELDPVYFFRERLFAVKTAEPGCEWDSNPDTHPTP